MPPTTTPVRPQQRPPSLILVLGAIATLAFVELLWPHLQTAVAGAVRAINEDILRQYCRY